MRAVLVLAFCVLLAACTTPQPANTSNLCEIFGEHRSWYHDAREASERWGSSIPTLMAIVHQESRFEARARPPRRYYLGFIPGRRPSDAYGYAQAKDSTWDWYREEAGGRWARRHRFGDAVDFVGWYNHQSQRLSGIGPDDTYNLYLAYHEGHGGYNRGTYGRKEWLRQVARRVDTRSRTFARQLQGCEDQLQRSRFLGIF